LCINGKITTVKQTIATKIYVDNYKLKFTQLTLKSQAYRHLEPVKFSPNLDEYLVWKL